MNDFQTALGMTIAALKDIRENSAEKPAVPVEILNRLVQTVEQTPEAEPVSVIRETTPVMEPAQVAVPAPPPEPAAPAEIPADPSDPFEQLRQRVLACERCEHLVRSRHTVVFGVGNRNARLMFVGEAPGADEDLQGEPFVGRAGQMLTKMIAAMGYTREKVYIANVLKCRPDMPPGSTGNRQPTPEEMATCLPYLKEQIRLIQPEVIVALGSTAMHGLFNDIRPMNQMRGRWHEFETIPVMATYHPAYLLRNPANSEKRKVWEDLLQVLEQLGDPVSAKQRGYFLDKK